VTRPYLAAICRHPVKSAGYEELAAVELAEGRPMPWDRTWAVAHAAAPFAADPDGWQPKMAFLRGWAEGSLMAIRARFDEASRTLHLTHPARPPFEGLMPAAGAALVDWLRPLWPANRPEPVRLVVRRDGGALSDVPEPWVSVASLASNRALGQRLGMALSIHRWRANLWLEGLAPWEEFDLVGREIRIGPVRLRVEERIGRCRATCANPESGRMDADTLGALEDGYGHQDFGVYARVIGGGRVALGDPVAW
jgi:uncharacterized protein YcbX